MVFAVRFVGAHRDGFVIVFGPDDGRAVGLEPLGEPLAGDQVQLGFLDRRIVAELEIAGLKLGPVAADMAGIERDADALERLGRIGRRGLGLVMVGQRSARRCRWWRIEA